MEYINQLIMSYKPKGLLVDTNLLLLYFIGAYDPERISRFERTMAFTIDEFLLLAMFLGLFQKILGPFSGRTSPAACLTYRRVIRLAQQSPPPLISLSSVLPIPESSGWS